MFEANIILFSTLMIPYTIIYIKKYKLSPVSVFLIMQMSFFYGICMDAEGRTDVAVKLETLYVVANLFFVIGVETSKRITIRVNSKSSTEVCRTLQDNPINQVQRLILWIIVVFSVVLSAYVFAKAGANVFIKSVLSFISGDTTAYKDERNEYQLIGGMGYINQFRVILLPVCLVGLIISQKKKNWLGITGAFIVIVICMLGTGQRAPFIYFCIVVFFYFLYMRSEFRQYELKKWQIIGLAIAFGFIMIVMTFANGRVGGDNSLKDAIQSVIDRFLSGNQKAAILGFKYIDTQPTVWGYDWAMCFRDLLPGKSDYLTVDRISYYMAFGSYYGTNPPCLWGSSWYNFSVLGVSIFPFILGCLYHGSYKKMLRTKNKNKLYILIYAAICVYIGVWVYGTPVRIFNNGVITLLLLRWILFKFVASPTSSIQELTVPDSK